MFTKRLKHLTDKPEKYIRFFGLRNHGEMPNGDPVTEMIYIHSKVILCIKKVLDC